MWVLMIFIGVTSGFYDNPKTVSIITAEYGSRQACENGAEAAIKTLNEMRITYKVRHVCTDKGVIAELTQTRELSK